MKAAQQMNYSDTNRPIGATAFVSIAEYVTKQAESAVKEPTLGVFEHLSHEELEAAHGRVRSFREDWKFAAPAWKSAYNHACSNGELGEFLRSYSKTVGNAGGIQQFATIFIYDKGTVIWTANKSWLTVMAVEGETWQEYQARVTEAALN